MCNAFTHFTLARRVVTRDPLLKSHRAYSQPLLQCGATRLQVTSRSSGLTWDRSSLLLVVIPELLIAPSLIILKYYHTALSRRKFNKAVNDCQFKYLLKVQSSTIQAWLFYTQWCVKKWNFQSIKVKPNLWLVVKAKFGLWTKHDRILNTSLV